MRRRDRLIGLGEAVLPRYERITFEKSFMAPAGQVPEAFVCPGHPLLDAVIDLSLERHRDLLRQGAILVDENNEGDQPRVLLYLEHSIQDGSRTRSGLPRTVSKRMLYVDVDANGNSAGQDYAPYLDYRPLTSDDPDLRGILARPECNCISGEVETKAVGFAVASLESVEPYLSDTSVYDIGRFSEALSEIGLGMPVVDVDYVTKFLRK